MKKRNIRCRYFEDAESSYEPRVYVSWKEGETSFHRLFTPEQLGLGPEFRDFYVYPELAAINNALKFLGIDEDELEKLTIQRRRPL